MAPARLVALLLVHGIALGVPVVVLANAAQAAPDCRCVYAGRYYQAGERACIRTPNGARFARCGKVSNLSSWRFTDERCGPSARRTVPYRALTAILPRAGEWRRMGKRGRIGPRFRR